MDRISYIRTGLHHLSTIFELYTETTAQVKVASHLPEPLKITNRLRMAPIRFNQCAEIALRDCKAHCGEMEIFSYHGILNL